MGGDKEQARRDLHRENLVGHFSDSRRRGQTALVLLYALPRAAATGLELTVTGGRVSPGCVHVGHDLERHRVDEALGAGVRHFALSRARAYVCARACVVCVRTFLVSLFLALFIGRGKLIIDRGIDERCGSRVQFSVCTGARSLALTVCVQYIHYDTQTDNQYQII